jgi:hypothetical protein
VTPDGPAPPLRSTLTRDHVVVIWMCSYRLIDTVPARALPSNDEPTNQLL